MKTLTNAGARIIDQSLEATPPVARHEAPEAAIRPLQDWELLLAAGGDGEVGWP